MANDDEKEILGQGSATQFYVDCYKEDLRTRMADAKEILENLGRCSATQFYFHCRAEERRAKVGMAMDHLWLGETVAYFGQTQSDCDQFADFVHQATPPEMVTQYNKKRLALTNGGVLICACSLDQYHGISASFVLSDISHTNISVLWTRVILPTIASITTQSVLFHKDRENLPDSAFRMRCNCL